MGQIRLETREEHQRSACGGICRICRHKEWGNLVDNAVRYTPRRQVRVTLTEREDQMVSTVTDTGIGISTEELTRIYRPERK